MGTMRLSDYPLRFARVRECLNRLILTSEEQLKYVSGEYLEHCNHVGVFRRGRFTLGAVASIGNSEARPLYETHIPPVLSTVARYGAFSALSIITSYCPKRHKGLAMAFSYYETIGE